MEKPKTPSQNDSNASTQAKPATEKPITDKDAANISGGLMGGDDDLDDLEVERLRRR